MWVEGIAYFKLFTCTTHGVPGLDAAGLEDAFSRIAAFGGACLVHCEDESLTLRAEEELRGQDRDDGGLLIEWRSRQAEEVAVAVAGVLAARTGVKATVAHVSSPSVAEIVRWARSRGADVAAEACPQYFALREDDVRTQGPLRKFTPPARLETDEEEAEMWGLLRSGVLTHLSTDHAPSTLEQKAAGIWDAPFGLPGLDTTSAVLLDAAAGGRMTLEDVVRVYAEQPARRYGLFPRKGVIAVGSDADIVLVDPDRRWTVANTDIISKAGWSPLDGRTLVGGVHSSYLRGRLVASERRPLGERTGRFLAGPGAG
jgi:dihydroorotase-like cyclic amidohydrolase